MMGTLLLVGIVMLAVGGTVGVGALALGRRDGRATTRRDASAAERGPMNLRVRDVVVHLGQTWIVSGRIRCDEAGTTWFLYRLEDGAQRRVLRARLLDRLELDLVEEVKEDVPAQGEPARLLSWEGSDYALTGWSQVRAYHDGQTGRSGKRLELYAFAAPGQKVALLERWEDREILGVGRRIEAHHLDILPGDEVEGEPQRPGGAS